MARPVRMLLLGALAAAVALAACPPAPCDASSCNGCCDPSGDCLPGSLRSACGLSGAACQACAKGELCTAHQCLTPDAGPDAGPRICDCPGCCLGDGGCLGGNLPAACGLGGVACQRCPGAERCDQGFCTAQPCGGCLDAVGACQAGTTELACGADGGLCAGCYSSQRCVDGACQAVSCTSASCQRGCCVTASQCLATPTDLQCGTAGSTCVACNANQHCSSGRCL